MLQFFKKLNNKKGASLTELMVIVSMISITIAGVSVKAQDLFDAAKDTQRIANLRQLATAVELYYSDHQSYPRVNGNSSQQRWDDFISKLATGHYLGSFPTEKENYDYQDLNGGQTYVLKVFLEDGESSYLGSDWDGVIGNLNCDDPFYCIRM